MFVGSDPELADACSRAMPAVALLRVGNATAAVQRMLVTRPLVVIVDASLNVDQVQDIAECARDIRAGVVQGAGMTAAQVAAAITEAALDAEKRRAQQPPSIPPVDEDDD